MPDEPRCKEILTWIRNHPEVTRYAEGLDKRITQAHRANADSKRLDAIPGFGVILSTAVVATMTDPKSFKTGREFAAWIGLVPRQNSTGGKERLGSISKQGDRYLRRLLVARKSRVIMV
jgi:transposase